MEKAVFRNLLKEIENGIKENKKVIDQALNKELSKGNSIKLEKITGILNDFKKAEEYTNEAQSIAVSYSGKPEITVTYILDSILYNNKITLCVNEYKIINDVLVSIIVESMAKLDIKNLWINYSSNYNEIYLRDNQKNFDKIIYIGDFFEYEQFKYFFKEDVEYNNYGFIKLFIDKTKNKEEYNKIMKFAASENLYLETYDELQEFINESKSEDFAVAFVNDFKDINKLQKEIVAAELLINNFPYDSYKFRVIR